jgi:hypothetical protein
MDLTGTTASQPPVTRAPAPVCCLTQRHRIRRDATKNLRQASLSISCGLIHLLRRSGRVIVGILTRVYKSFTCGVACLPACGLGGGEHVTKTGGTAMANPIARAADPGLDVQASREMLAEMDEAATGSQHWKILLTSGMGFFTDAYDLFIIGVVATMITSE